MKILLVSPLPPAKGGIATWTGHYLDWCKGNDIEVNVVNTSVIGDRVDNFNKINYAQEIKRNLNIISISKKMLKDASYDIVHINTSCSSKGMVRDVIVAKKAKKRHCKVVLHCHCNVEDNVKGKLANILFKKLVKLSDCIITLNTDSQKFVYEKFGKENEIFPNFIDCKDYGKCVIKENIKNILFVGHVLIDKGVGEIYETARRLPNYCFNLIGNVSNEVKELAKPNNINLLGEMSKDNVMQHMLENDIFLFPSYTEGFPLVILEAMSVGLPIISTGVGAISDMLCNGVGKLIKVRDVDDIISKISELEDISSRQDMSNREIQKIEDEYLVDKVMTKLMKQYKSVKGNK